MDSHMKIYAECLTCLKEIVSIIASAPTQNIARITVPKSKKRSRQPKRIQSRPRLGSMTILVNPSLKSYTHKYVVRNSSLNALRPHTSYSLKNLKQLRLSAFALCFPVNQPGKIVNRKYALSTIFRVNYYDLGTLLIYVHKYEYFKTNILSLIEPRVSATDYLPGYLFGKGLNTKTCFASSWDFLQSVCIDLTDFPSERLITESVKNNSRKFELIIRQHKTAIKPKRAKSDADFVYNQDHDSNDSHTLG